MEVTCSSKHRPTFIGLRGLISQKTELFIVTATRTPNITNVFLYSEISKESGKCGGSVSIMLEERNAHWNQQCKSKIFPNLSCSLNSIQCKVL
jgi:hypothetical protein